MIGITLADLVPGDIVVIKDFAGKICLINAEGPVSTQEYEVRRITETITTRQMRTVILGRVTVEGHYDPRNQGIDAFEVFESHDEPFYGMPRCVIAVIRDGYCLYSKVKSYDFPTEVTQDPGVGDTTSGPEAPHPSSEKP